ncbi:site-specific DNA-methyltransferase [Staphylococcus epidermidis]|uniref:DNA methyltransferase n=1 Tax=Staphylococcus aureus TaxID=1280 RepID=UPI000CD45677|nr:site-specific DNA-methyltransferase [Staphylococcus epidermidis]HAR2823333.1 site-specific DNA-methyltransferase [Staphylococcus aureus]MCG1240994.1 site-specific DNA-methyltransferase [Staphylococcus epidermidis]MCG1504592.1 site-specific DNA-methyltransferase [Staphylococcus epidermidis]MCG1557326.1 site-specific DNA-methyltransferase [Staphylococcus epidermidis]
MIDNKRNYLKKLLYEEKLYDIESQLLDTIILDMSRIADSEITNIINRYKKDKNIIISSTEKNLLRKSILGYDVDISNYYDFDNYILLFNKNSYILGAYELIIEGVDKNKDGVLGSLYSRTKLDTDIDNKYANYIADIESKFTQLLYFNLDNNGDTNKLFSSLNSLYSSLENYHYCLIEFQSKCTWDQIYKIAIYLENFKVENDLNAFKKEKQINTMLNFVKSNFNLENQKSIIEDIDNFYEGVNYGFQFQDLIITEDGERKLLVFQKVELDENYIPCPSCFETILRGNSYPKMLYRSFECQNPNCPSRSKSGRGKRFDYYSIKRNNKLILNNSSNYIENDLRNQFRRDIVDNNSDFLEFGIKFYTWIDNEINIIDNKQHPTKLFDRLVKSTTLDNYPSDSSYFYNLTIYKLLESIYSNSNINNIDKKKSEHTLTIDKATIINGNSTSLLNSKNYKNMYNLAITSPPYFNAREYSQWDNLILYLFDMMMNAKGVYNSLQEKGIYAYNIGDIVDKDKIYINSQMSIKRQMLGFYSMMIFEIVGFNIIGNDIWDKGEVQSKRNSSSNSFPGFLKPINCYEHIIYIQKGGSLSSQIPTEITKIDTVRKINSKGENKYGHTAPYPENLVKFVIKKLLPDINSNINILDPFLGSGTSCIVSNHFNYNSTGIEMNADYFNLSHKRLLIDYENISFNI